MEVSFNELSISTFENKYDATDSVINFTKTFKELSNKGIKRIRSCVDAHEITLCKNYSLHDWLIDKDFKKHSDYKNLLYSTITKPFIKEDDTRLEDTYINNNYYFEDKETEFPKTETLGLVTSHLYKIPSISFDPIIAFQKSVLKLRIEKDQEINEAEIFNLHSPGCIEIDTIKLAIESMGDIDLVKSVISIEDKKANRHLADHHGLSIQNSFCDNLENSEYVDNIRSVRWGEKKFIRSYNEKGEIEIVMHWTDKKYAFLVKTTGRNLRETAEIAKILKKKYDK